MISDIKDIFVGITYEPAEDEESSAFPFALSLAKQTGARLTIQAASLKVAVPTSFLSRFGANVVATENMRLRELATAAAEEARGTASLAGVVCTTETPHLSYMELASRLSQDARTHDFTVLDADAGAVSADRGYIESALFESGRPAIIVPPGNAVFAGRRIAVAWDGGPRAARALNDALPFLKAAEKVQIISVSGEKDLSRSVPGADIAPHLVAHGIDAELVDVPSVRGDAAEAIRQHIKKHQIDMLVMGAFAHSWIRQVVLGGVTQSLLKASPVPLFMSY